MSDVVKSGYIKRYSNSFMDGGWKKIWVVLHRDSKLVIYKKQSDTSSKGHVIMKDVCKYFAFGQYAEKFPERPTLPKDGKMDWVLAIPQKPSSQAKIHWFLCESDKDVNEWMQAIVSTLPVVSHKGGAPPPSSAPPPAQAPYGEQVQAVKSNTVSAPPPPGYPAAPPPYSAGPPVGTLGFDAMHISGSAPGAAPPPPAGGYYPQQTYPAPGGYPQQPPAPQYQPPAGQYQQPYPQQQYPQQQYPQQQYPQQQYPQQQYYPQQPAGAGYPRQPYTAPPAQGGYYTQQGQYVAYPQGQQYAPRPQTQYVQQQPQVVYVKEKKNKGILGGSTASAAAGLAGGALLGYGAARMMSGPCYGYGGYGGFGGFGMGRWGSWSSLSSCGSFGSFSSFGSWD